MSYIVQVVIFSLLGVAVVSSSIYILVNYIKNCTYVRDVYLALGCLCGAVSLLYYILGDLGSFIRANLLSLTLVSLFILSNIRTSKIKCLALVLKALCLAWTCYVISLDTLIFCNSFVIPATIMLNLSCVVFFTLVSENKFIDTFFLILQSILSIYLDQLFIKMINNSTPNLKIQATLVLFVLVCSIFGQAFTIIDKKDSTFLRWNMNCRK